MVRWEYCEVFGGTVVIIRYLTEEGDGWDCHEVAERGVNNMAVVLARLGREGWEVIDIRPHNPESILPSYTADLPWTLAFFKRPLASSE